MLPKFHHLPTLVALLALIVCGQAIGQETLPPLEPVPLPAPVPKEGDPGSPLPNMAPRASQTSHSQTPTPAERPLMPDQPFADQFDVPADTVVIEPWKVEPDEGFGLLESHEMKPQEFDQEVIVAPQPVPPVAPYPWRSSAGYRQVPLIGTPQPMTSPPVPVSPPISSSESIRQRTVVRAHFVDTPHGPAYVPRSTSFYRESPEGKSERVTVYRWGPMSRVATVQENSTTPRRDWAAKPAPPPSQALAPARVNAEGQVLPPRVPGQPVRNKIRAAVW